MVVLSDHKPIKIAIIAMGGQGGGVLSKWITDLAEANDFLAQYTSVPGVAQRTGATIYYVELFRQSHMAASGKQPILALTPAEGDVDIVIASEMMEVGRSLLRGFVTKRTTLIGSSHREYAIVEKQELGDGRRDTAEIDALGRETAANYICFDMDQVARATGAVISSVLFGALCASSALPFTRQQYEDTIRASGKAVEINLKGFAAGIEASGGIVQRIPTQPEAEPTRSGIDPKVNALVKKLGSMVAGTDLKLALAGLNRVIDFQDTAYGQTYVERLAKLHAVDKAAGGENKSWALTAAVARQLALAMAYDDVIRVADIKTRSGRFETFRQDIKAADGQIVHIREYMHPRWQEICEILPHGIGERLVHSEIWNRITAPLFGKGRRIATTSLSGFILLFTLGRLRWMRRTSLRFAREQERIAEWLALIEQTAARDYDLAVEIAGLQRLVKGYGETHERSLNNVGRILASLPRLENRTDAAHLFKTLKQAALADDEGRGLDARLAELEVAV